MYDRRLVGAGAALVLVVVAAIGFVLLAPRWTAGALDRLAQQQLGRSLTVRGSTHLDFSPLEVRLDDATLSGAARDDDSLVIARSLVVPVTLAQLFGGRPSLTRITVSEADVALVINERGEANWDFPGFTLAGPLHVSLQQANIHYFDTRNSQGLTLGRVDGALDLRADGGASFTGTGVINSRLVKIDADVKSLARINADGSPLEVAMAANAGVASFSGRLSTAKVLSLAGPVSLSSLDPAAGLQLIGLPLPDGTTLAGPLTIDGGLDTAGRAYAIRNATLALGDVHAVGDVVADLREAQPKLQANLAAEAVWLDPFVPASGAKDGDWGRVALPFARLKDFDAEVNIDARRLIYGAFNAGPSRLKVTLAGGKLEAGGALRLSNDGTLTFTARADATAIPPSAGLSLAAQGAEAQPLLSVLTGASQLTGTGDFAAELTASGTTQEELVGTLKGTASIALTGGRIGGTDLGSLFGAVKQKILDGWSAVPGGTAFDSLTGDATLADGIATIRGARMVALGLTVTVDGLVDLLRQGMEVKASAESDGKPLLPVAVIARGPWAQPKIYPDIPDILNNPEGGFARLLDDGPSQGN